MFRLSEVLSRNTIQAIFLLLSRKSGPWNNEGKDFVRQHADDFDEGHAGRIL